MRTGPRIKVSRWVSGIEQAITEGIAVGSVIGLEALFAGPICGASMNPVGGLFEQIEK
jgi:hypothetical protein